MIYMNKLCVFEINLFVLILVKECLMFISCKMHIIIKSIFRVYSTALKFNVEKRR